MKSGKMIIISAPSGAGKTTIVKSILAFGFNLEFSVSATCRPKRENETDGKDYYFLSENDFRLKIDEQQFIEWQEVYQNCFYGTLKSELERIAGHGNNIIFDVDVLGGLNLKKYGKTDALAIFIAPPSVAELETRLRNRHTESEESLLKRLARAEYEMSFRNQFDKVIVNDILETAIQHTREAIASFLHLQFS